MITLSKGALELISICVFLLTLILANDIAANVVGQCPIGGLSYLYFLMCTADRMVRAFDLIGICFS